jgi:NADP-dependent 3-hydroxy acid dehydrogenase YdfG
MRFSASQDLTLTDHCTSGIGLMMTKALALNGAEKVYIIGRRLEKLQEAAKESPHNNITPIQGDVTDKESIQSVAAQIRKETGYVNLLICNSGVSGRKLP